MKKISPILIIILLMTAKLYAQDLNFQNDSTFKKYDLDLLKNIAPNKLSGYQFQLRLYFNTGGNRIIPKYYLLLITLKKDVWTACKYTFTGKKVSRFNGEVKIDTESIKINNYKKLFKNLKKDGLFTQTSIGEDKILKLAHESGADSTLYIMSEGGMGYKIELLSPSANRGFYLNSPAQYYNCYHLKELKNPVIIMKELYGVMGMKNPG